MTLNGEPGEAKDGKVNPVKAAAGAVATDQGRCRLIVLHQKAGTEVRKDFDLSLEQAEGLIVELSGTIAALKNRR